MVGKATKAACDWIVSVYKDIERYQLEGSFATDKKTSWVNTLHTRGKKVIAEATIPAEKLKEIMRVSVEQIFEARLASQLGHFRRAGPEASFTIVYPRCTAQIPGMV